TTSKGMGLVANRGRCFKWAIEPSGPGGSSRSQSDQGSSQGDSLYPDSCLDKDRQDSLIEPPERMGFSGGELLL
uniref:Uncharacterized protein n=1 Tax=Panthera leo TaxID=9689 RepID=A0A8C8X378_PANLE